MKLPKVIDVGPLRYAVTTAKLRVARMSDDQLGECNPDKARIVLHPDQPATVMRESLLHECLHAITAQVGLASELGDDADEALVRRLSPALLDVLRRNRDLVAYLTNGAP